MTRRLLCLIFAILCLAGVQAASPWLKISQKDGVSREFTADGLTISVSNGMLIVTSGSEQTSLALESLESMEFTGDETGISGITNDDLTGPVEIYATSGILLNTCNTLDEARESLAGKTGVYLLKTKSQTLKITVR